MSTADLPTLSEYRDRREHRLRTARHLYRACADRSALLASLEEILHVTRCDRAAVVWVDEYGAGIVHTHVVLDLASDVPRRTFQLRPLRAAWEMGVPGAYERTGAGDEPGVVAVSLGSDGTRSWFVVADSVGPRLTMDAQRRERLHFLAGECAGVVLHRDLEQALAGGTEAEVDAPARPRFAGWHILQDLDGREHDEPAAQRITERFLVGRMVRLLLEDDLATPVERLAEQVSGARKELPPRDAEPPAMGIRDGVAWERETRTMHDVLDALERRDLRALAQAVVRLGECAEDAGHGFGAEDLFGAAYEVAAQVGDARVCAAALRSRARVRRRGSRWDEAREDYDRAREIAEAAGDDAQVARCIAGSAIIDKERGELAVARTRLLEALPYAARSGDANSLGSVYHELLSVERADENYPRALEYGWLAVTTYDRLEEKVKALATLAGALMAVGQYRAAEDAWTVVANRARQAYYRIYAWDALGHIAALRGDEAEFERCASRCDALNWEEGTQSAAQAEILFYRGLSYRALGRIDDARAWLERAVHFCQEHGIGRLLPEAEQALHALDVAGERAPEAVVTPLEAPAEVRQGLRAMRLELAAAGM